MVDGEGEVGRLMSSLMLSSVTDQEAEDRSSRQACVKKHVAMRSEL